MIKLTEQQRLEIGEGDKPVHMVDPVTNREFYLIRAEEFSRLLAVLGDLDPRDTYAAVDRAFAANWDEPKMADYDDYEQHQR